MDTSAEISEIEMYSVEDGDSNAMMMPGKKNKKRKRKDQGLEKVKLSQQPKLSKSQKRKLKKLEEEKEKEILLSKSIENLEKYKIPEHAYSLLRSSKSIGRAETKMEKRRMAVQFSKAGLQVPLSGISSKETVEEDSLMETEPEFDHISSRVQVNKINSPGPMVPERHIANDPPDSRESPEDLGELDALPAETVPNEENNVSLEQGNRSLSKADEIPSVDDISGSNNVQNCPLQRHITAPTVVHVSRSDEVENKRKDLPIVMMEQEIMEAINENEAIIVCGETGCGKTTQVPQFLYEAGYSLKRGSTQSVMIGVTQPRRVAVLATAKRVAFELGLGLGKEVGFQVRHDKKISKDCSIKFMTDGILLREVQEDFLLKRYSVLILDEAHERSLNTDILIGMLSRVIRLREDLYKKQQKMLLSGKTVSSKDWIYPLKVILMSATLRVEDFKSNARLFVKPPPVIEVPTRQYPVSVHFSKRTDIVDYIGQAFKKVMAIHKKLPPGGILVFVTGQREVQYLCDKLLKASGDLVAITSRREIISKAAANSEMASVEDNDMKYIREAFEIPGNSSDRQTDWFSSYDDEQCDFDDDMQETSYVSDTESDLEFDGEDDGTLSQNKVENDDSRVDLALLKAAFESLSGKDSPKPNSEGRVTKSVEISSEQSSPFIDKEKGTDKKINPGALRVLPLYAMLPAAEQLRVFEEIKEGERLLVVATNVAETSLTIPGIKYVVDTGREKVKNYNPSNGIESYEVQWISKASAAQRAGRAGRTGPGHCYRLYSSAVFSNIFPDFSCAEISKVPVDGVVLLLKSMGIEKVQNFPFPTAPEATALTEAVGCLKALEALDGNERLTSLGKAMAYYPMSPRHSRMLLTVIQMMNVGTCARPDLVLGYAFAAAAALSLSNPFVMQFEGSHGNTDDSNEKTLQKQEKKRKKELKEITKASRQKFCNPSSDALTVAQALQSFELCSSRSEFCQENGLHFKTMEEMSKLRNQLLQLVFNQKVRAGDDPDQEKFVWTHGPKEAVEDSWRNSLPENRLSAYEEKLIGKAICAGWADRVAKHISASEASEANGRVYASRYQACSVKETVFLHRWSSLSRSRPNFLVYSELLQTKRPYMHGATSVEPSWLVEHASSMCSFSAPLTNPMPFYKPEADEVYNWVVPCFGPHLWPLPKHCVPVTGEDNRVRVFAFALLEGQVLPCLSTVRKNMSAPPSIVLKPESYGQKRVGSLLYKLKKNCIDSRAGLREMWKANPKALDEEILDWFQDGFQQFEELWAKMLHEALTEHFPKKGKRDKKKK